jgi:hypothetical protein
VHVRLYLALTWQINHPAPYREPHTLKVASDTLGGEPDDGDDLVVEGTQRGEVVSLNDDLGKRQAPKPAKSALAAPGPALASSPAWPCGLPRSAFNAARKAWMTSAVRSELAGGPGDAADLGGVAATTCRAADAPPRRGYGCRRRVHPGAANA